MKISCEVLSDLLPLYTEGLLSNDSIELVESHIQECHGCKKELEAMGDSGNSGIHGSAEKLEKPKNRENSKNPALDTDTRTLKKIRKKIFYGKMKWVLLAILGSLVMAILLITYITAPNYLPFDEERVTVMEGVGTAVYLEFGEEVTGHDINRYENDTGQGYEYRITTWDTLWSRIRTRSSSSMIVLNPEGEAVSSIFYYTTDGQWDQLIYGRNPNPNGGSVTLPRLALNYYVTLAAVCLIVFLILRKLFQKKQKIQRFFEVGAMLFGSYLLSHGILHGLSGVSYSMLRDFTGILLLAITIFIFLLVVQNIIWFKKEIYRQIN